MSERAQAGGTDSIASPVSGLTITQFDAGAQVIAHVGAPGRGEGLAALGAAEVILNLDSQTPFYGVLENVGGELLANAYSLLEPAGILQSIGMASLNQPRSISSRRGCVVVVALRRSTSSPTAAQTGATRHTFWS